MNIRLSSLSAGLEIGPDAPESGQETEVIANGLSVLNSRASELLGEMGAISERLFGKSVAAPMKSSVAGPIVGQSAFQVIHDKIQGLNDTISGIEEFLREFRRV